VSVAAALERLRDAGRLLCDRSARDVHEALANVLDAWSAADSKWQQALAKELPATTGFSPACAKEGLARGLARYDGAALRALVRAEVGDFERLGAARGNRIDGFETTATVLAGAIPLPSFVAVLAPLALRSPVLVKLAAHDPVTVPLFVRSLAERDPLLGACVEIADFRRDDVGSLAALCRAPCVAATGSDAAVAAIAARMTPSQRFVASGHRFSLALLGPGSTREPALTRAAEALALDVALWDQLGCLSPVSIHVAGADPRATDRVAHALAGALEAAEARWPRGRVEIEAAAAVTAERAEAEMRAAAGRRVDVLAPRGTEWTVVREADAALRAAPLHRFVRVHPAADLDAALAAIGPHAAKLAAVALDGFGDASATIAAELARLGASRVCAPGTLQTPPLDWPRDGRPVLLPFARRSAIEIDSAGA
jgi:hypothetical protein